MEFIRAYMYGLADLNFWGYVVVALFWVHTTLLGITLFYHREQAHRSIDLHPILQHFFRFWLWASTGAVTKEWVAIHRKHHARCEQEGDPHSPQIFGLKKVVLEGAELYQQEAMNSETLEKYGRGTPDDWVERQVYSRFPNLGIVLLILFDLIVFGIPGIALIGIQLITMPFLAAGIINGVGHAIGYRNFETNDASTNLWPIAIFIAGEELHNNHHAFPTSAKFSMRPYEFDLGWAHLKVFSFLGLAKIRRVAPQPHLEEKSDSVNLDALRAIMVNRMHVLRHYTNSVALPVLRNEAEGMGEGRRSIVRAAKRGLRWQPQMLDEPSRNRFRELVDSHPRFQAVLQFRNELKQLWEGAYLSNDKLLAEFGQWCARAEASGIQGMQDFVDYLRSFGRMPESAST